MKANPWRVIAAACILAIGAGIFVFAVSNDSAGQKDFIEYWASGQQLAHGANPYDNAAIYHLERTAGFDGDHPLISFSPPVVLVLALPLGFLSAKTGVIVWLLAILVALVLSIRMIREIHGNPEDRLHLLGYCFAPVLACLMAGQLGIFLLFGIVFFLRFHGSWPFLAGLFLLPCALKPHLFVPVGLVLLLWGIQQKRYRVLAGFFTAVVAGAAVVMLADHSIWLQYRAAMQAGHPLDLFIPTLSLMLRLAVDKELTWIQFVPEAVACVWGSWYFFSRRGRWSWNRQGLLLLLASALCAPYAFFSDEAMLLPAVLGAVYFAVDRGRSLIPFGIVAGAALIEVFFSVKMTSPYYLWTVPAWLGWYLYATRDVSAAERLAGQRLEQQAK
jgi:hypothetical protein